MRTVTIPPLPRLQPEVPGAPLVETMQYRFPPATPMAPPAHECDREQLLDVAADAIRDRSLALVSSRDHVTAICKLVQELDLEVDMLGVENRALRRELDSLRAAKISASVDRLTITVAGRNYAEVNAGLGVTAADIDALFDGSESIEAI